MPEAVSPWRLSVAPMLDWTDKHCRFLHRLLSRRTRLYTEMVTTGALLHGAERRHLRFDAVEHPLALQLGGSEAADLAACARIGARWGYDEINLNCGCPSERVQRGAFGACLMAEPQLVADGVKAMVDAVDVPVSVKHRIGIDREESYDFVRDFVGTVAEAGCRVFIVHARNAWLQGLSPKENREIPPLRHALVYRLKRDFPQLTIVLNGGVTSDAQITEHLQHVDGVMLGREAYHHPWMMSRWDAEFLGGAACALTQDEVEAEMVAYMARELAEDGTPWSAIARHMLGLHHGRRGARLWRQVWSDHRLKARPAAEVAALARSHLAAGAHAGQGAVAGA
ncbi:MAG: tRNA dihydrouridine(20/20a) synthase DusA [Rubrivivax sp.]|uniref:tRNA dihydrouridine(20/20a) synthase DusA n=1 Tax=Ottowia sp. TaxID=1898956 RepID=UPI002178B478|nr:tRNA dihydrouridine(20/20a) synthase DusA [Ottowia sp.]MCC6814539.1 tRNA dihydrouridine(20/20a) synthase DusA [Rubrivivax sp.]MCZ2087959.1 tRNA dihydrouridine(20/20a) synthase DusA [Burkholderiales bacterium]HNE60782.1 tRNA dihydrouridine(20/20a) synthase DusA [Ottowia sp.]HNI85005.1 tRNA dihydrouridine(20/20a) synthase DusA [Ottowia sp.]HNL43100.1 tRNA dihydrouridine(20/20a) synthase DusA [Ottowia sp.]